MLTTQGCLCTRLTPPGRWPTLLGRPQLGLTASGMADLNLHVAMLLKELQLPAALAKVVLSGAVHYIAAATAAGPLVPDTGRPAS